MKKFARIFSIALIFCLVLTMAAAAATPPAKPSGGGSSGGGSAPGGGGSSGGGSSSSVTYSSVYGITSDTAYDGVSLSSTTGDENVIDVSNGASMVLTDSTVSNTGSGSGGDNSSFYGVGASLLVRSGKLYVDNTSITTSGTGNAGVFAYSSGTAYVNNTTITTSGSSAGGLHVAGGGTLYAWNCNVTTSASSASAAIRSDRGGGTMVIDGGTYNTTGGTGAVYVTADITVHNATLISGASEAVAMEGRNTLRLFDCSLSGTMTSSGQNSGSVSTWGIILYQSMSGDSEVGTAEFQMDGGDLTVSTSGPLFYTTNTSSVFTLRGVDIKSSSKYGRLLVVAGNNNSRGWGTSGSNGATCTFTAYDQTLSGDIAYDSISSLNLYLLDGTTLTGAITKDNSLNGGSSGSKTSNVYVGSGSTWTVTGSSTVTGTLYNAGTIENAKIVNTSGKTLATFGSGTYTVTVGAYSTSASTSGAGTLDSWSSHAAANPFESGTVPSITPTRPVSGNASWMKDTSGNWTYVTAEGDVVTGWLTLNGKTYYLDPDNGGVMVTGQKQIDGKTYTFLSSGAMYTGWQQSGSTWYYFGSAMYASQWLSYNGSWYYFDADGKMVTGPQTIEYNGTVNAYDFASNGKMLTGWQQIDNVWYYFGSAMYVNQWLSYNGSWYYFDDTGAMVTGLQTIEYNGTENTYDFASNGKMLTGWQQIGGTWYYFGSAMYADQWVKYNGSWYYLDTTGAMVTGLQTIEYNGSLNTYDFADSGRMLSGWQKIDNVWYYFGSAMYADQWLKYNGSWYYFASNGAMVTGTVTVYDGTVHSFDSNGKWLGAA